MKQVAIVLLFLLAVSGASLLPLVSAEEGLRQLPERGGESLLKPVRELLSGTSALIVEGKDPRFTVFSKRLREDEFQKSSPILQAPAAAALVPFRSPSPKFSRNILLSRDLGSIPIQTEPHIAVNPKDPGHIVVGVIDYNSPASVSYVSFDRGATWEGPNQPKYLERDLGSGGDPTVAFARNGELFMSQISIGVEEFSIGGIAFAELVSSISVTSSGDGGLTWSKPYSASRSTVKVDLLQRPVRGKAGTIELSFLDKPWMTVGPSSRNPNSDAIYVTYTKFSVRFDIILIFGGELFFFANPVVETTIELVRSEDGGRTWSSPVRVSPVAARYYTGQEAQVGVQGRVVQGSQVAVDPNGVLYVAWFDSTDDGPFRDLGEIWMARSETGGRTFTRPAIIASFSEPPFSPRNAFFRSWASAFPQIAIGPRAEISIVYTARPSDRPTDDGDIFHTRSEDGGRTWSRARRVNDDNTDRLQFFPTITVDNKGTIHAMWGDFRDDKTEKSYHIYYSKSEDGGKKWIESARVTDFPSNPNRAFPRGLFIGDYYAIKAAKDEVYLVWADSRLGEFGGFNQKIGFARSSPMPSPTIFVTPPRGPGGEDIVIQASNFQPEQEIFVEVGGAIVTGTRSNKDGRALVRTFVPISGEGVHDIRVFDASGNLAVASFFIDFGFDTQRSELKKIGEALSSVASGATTKPGTPPLPTDLLGRVDTKLDAFGKAVNESIGKTQQNVLRALSDLSAELAGVNELVLIVAVLAVVAIALSAFSVVSALGRRR